MLNVEALQGATSLLTNDAAAWLVVPPGMLIGLIFGTIPGLSISIGMAIFLPLTLHMDFLYDVSKKFLKHVLIPLHQALSQ